MTKVNYSGDQYTEEMIEKENDWQATGTSFKYKTKIIEIVSYFYPTWEKIIRILELRNQANKEGKANQFSYALVCIILDRKTFKESGNKLKLKKENKDLKEENHKLNLLVSILEEENSKLKEEIEVRETNTAALSFALTRGAIAWEKNSAEKKV